MWIELSEMFDKMIFSVFHPSFILCCAFDRFPRPLTLFILFRPFSDPFLPATTCFRCSSDEYALQGNTAACITCPEGHATDTGSSDAGTACAPCAAGRTFAEGACHDCEKGFWSPETNTPVECVACVKGKYGDQLARVQESDCINCVAGKYNDVLGIADASSCKDCPQGYVGGGGGGVVCCCLLLFVVSDLFFLCTLCYSLLLSLSSFGVSSGSFVASQAIRFARSFGCPRRQQSSFLCALWWW